MMIVIITLLGNHLGKIHLIAIVIVEKTDKLLKRVEGRKVRKREVKMKMQNLMMRR